MDWDTDTKQVAREIALQRAPLAHKKYRGNGRHNYARTALSLPGGKLLCVREGYGSGLYRPSTYHLFVERDPVVQAAISKRLHNLGSRWEPYFHRDELHLLDLRRALLGDTLDWAYLDLCGTLNSRTSWWIRNVLAPNLSCGAGLAITVTRNWRSSKLMLAACHILRRTELGREILDDMYDQVSAAACVGNTAQSYLMLSENGPDSSFVREDRNWGHYGKRPFLCSDRLAPVFHNSSLEILGTLQLLMPNHKFRVDGCVEYQRTPGSPSHHMTTLRLADIHVGPPSAKFLHAARRLDKHLLAPQELAPCGN